MRLEKLRARNLGPFRDVEIDFTAIEGQLIAITGANGEGKSTLLELFAGSLYRKCPTRGSLSDLATARDSMLETTVVNGARHTLRHLVDGVSGKSEALVLDDAGAPVLSSAKVRDFDQWAAKNLLPESVLYSGPFAAQGRRGFLDLSATERKKLLVQMMPGLERLQRQAERAGEFEKAARQECEKLRARLADLKEPDLGSLEALTSSAENDVRRATEAAQGAREALEKAKRAAGDIAVQLEYVAARKAAAERVRAAHEQVSDIEARMLRNREVLSDRDAIMGAVKRSNELTQELGEANAESGKAHAALDAAKLAVRQAEQSRQDTYRQWLPVEARCKALSERVKERATVLAAEAMAAQLLAKVVACEEREAELGRAIESLQALMMSGKDTRIAGLRAGFEKIACCYVEFGEGCGQYADDQLKADSAERDAQEEAPAKLEQAKNELGGARVVGSVRNELVVLRLELSQAQKTAARVGEIAQAEADLATADQEYKRLEAEHEARSTALDAARAALKAAENIADHRYAFASNVATEIDNLAPWLAKRQPLEQAEARLEELAARLPAAEEAYRKAHAELEAIPAVEAAEPVNLAAHEHSLRQAEANEQNARAHHTRCAETVSRAYETRDKREALQREILAFEWKQSNWARLAADLGRDGVQAHELDAALPEINELCNQLLHDCHGPRFTVELRSTKLDASGKRELEALDFRVIDTVKGREADADTFSGGECVIVGEAVALALTMVSCRRAGLEGVTLVRDESGAALDPGNARAYVSMLRMAAKHLGAHRVLLVSHVPEVQELCDARIVVADGKVSVQ